MKGIYILEALNLDACVGVDGTRVTVEAQGHIIDPAGNITPSINLNFDVIPKTINAQTVTTCLYGMLKKDHPEVLLVGGDWLDDEFAEDEFSAIDAAVKAFKLV